MENSFVETLGAVHQQLDRSVNSCLGHLAAGDGKVTADLVVLNREFDRHMKFEEEVLFPAVLETRSAYSRMSIKSLTVDHGRIRSLLSEIQHCVETGDLDGARISAEDLRIILDGHNREGEYGIYRQADRTFSDPERRTLLSRGLAQRGI